MMRRKRGGGGDKENDFKEFHRDGQQGRAKGFQGDPSAKLRRRVHLSDHEFSIQEALGP